MSNHFYGAYHWELSPIDDRLDLIDALEEFCNRECNLFIEAIRPSLMQRYRFWRMRSSYRTRLIPDALSPAPSVFHLRLHHSILQELKEMVARDGLDERSIAHIKGYTGDLGLFWFHGFCDQGDHTLSCSRHVDDATIEHLELKLGLKAVKKYGELKSDRERKEELGQLLDAMERYQETEHE